jgi:hypothetical protein
MATLKKIGSFILAVVGILIAIIVAMWLVGKFTDGSVPSPITTGPDGGGREEVSHLDAGVPPVVRQATAPISVPCVIGGVVQKDQAGHVIYDRKGCCIAQAKYIAGDDATIFDQIKVDCNK